MSNAISNTLRRTLLGVGRLATKIIRHRGWRQGPISAPTTRAAFLSKVYGDMLEIGPFGLPSLAGPRVAYFDVLDRAGLAERALDHGHDPAACPEIDYVSPYGDLTVIDRTFDSVFSSHVIEHQPDLLTHLNGVEKILAPGGRYFLIVPDRRYCFDHFTLDSTVADVVAAHDERRRVHTSAAVRQHWLELTHNDPLRHWIGKHGRAGSFNFSAEKAESDALRAEGGEYVDVHAWRFTPVTFHALFSDLHARGLVKIRPVEVNDTMFGQMEFFAILER